jgi:hypothetical protein
MSRGFVQPDVHNYKYKKQAKIVIVCCILHNLIKHQNTLQQVSDGFFNVPVQVDISEGNAEIPIDIAASDTEGGATLRETIKNALWASR